MNQKLTEILEQSSQLFMRFGVKSLTMDDVSKQLRISKKTLYQFVKDKSDLVTKCMQNSCQTDQNQIKNILKKPGNAIDQLFEISEFVVARLVNVHPSVFFDMEKNHPEAIQVFDQHRETFIASCIETNLTKGINEGLYRSDLNIPIIVKIYLNSINQALHGNLFSSTKHSLSQIFIELYRYHIRGISSEKGIEYLTQKVKKENLLR